MKPEDLAKLILKHYMFYKIHIFHLMDMQTNFEASKVIRYISDESFKNTVWDFKEDSKKRLLTITLIHKPQHRKLNKLN